MKLFLPALLLCLPLFAHAETCTLSLSTGATNYTVASNVTAQVLHASNGSVVGVNIGTNTVSYSFSGSTAQALPVVVGPCKITISGTAGSFCTLQLTSPSQFTPSTAVVIPNDAGGPVTIIMESSVDLLNWTPALPGAYGTSSSNRFFRVRAVR